jgi:hypothetical protein
LWSTVEQDAAFQGLGFVLSRCTKQARDGTRIFLRLHFSYPNARDVDDRSKAYQTLIKAPKAKPAFNNRVGPGAHKRVA